MLVEQHQNQAIAQKLGILGEKVTSMAKNLLGPIYYGAVRPLG